METERYRQWAAMLAASDQTLVQLALLSVAAVFMWERLATLPAPWRGRARLAYAALALGFLLVQLVTTRGALVAMLSVCVLSALAHAVYSRWRRRLMEGVTNGNP